MGSVRLGPLEWLLLAALLVVAFALRDQNLDPPTLTHDDAWVAYIDRARFRDVLTVGLTSPGFVFLEKVWLAIVGFSELRAQLPPFVAGVLAPAGVYLLLRNRVQRPLAALGAVLMAFVPIHIIYSQHVKQYTFEVLVGLGMIWIGWRILDEPARERNWKALALLSTLAVFFSFSLVIVALGPILAGLVRVLRSGWPVVFRSLRWIVGFGLVAFVWYFRVLRPRIPDGLQQLWGVYAGEGRYIDATGGFRLWVESLFRRVYQLLEWVTTFDPQLVAWIGLILLVALAFKNPYVFIMIATPLAGAVVLASLQLAPLGGNRTDIYLEAPLLVGLMVGLDATVDIGVSLWRRFNPTSADRELLVTAGSSGVLVLVGSAAAAISAAAFLAANPPPPYPVQDVQPLINEIETQRRDGDTVLLEYEAMYHYGLYGSVDSAPFVVTDYGYRHYWVDFDDPDLIRIHDPSMWMEYAAAVDAAGDRMWFLVSINPFNKATRDKWTLMTDYLRDELGWSMVRESVAENAVLELWER